jgi:hypothetical protein
MKLEDDLLVYDGGVKGVSDGVTVRKATEGEPGVLLAERLVNLVRAVEVPRMPALLVLLVVVGLRVAMTVTSKREVYPEMEKQWPGIMGRLKDMGRVVTVRPNNMAEVGGC